MVTTEQIRLWIAAGEEYRFYWTRDWKRKRRDILAMDKDECQKCKARGKYTRAAMVHHVRHLRDYPELALSTWCIDRDGVKQRQLLSLCDLCHDDEHPERMKQYKKREPITKERW